jgi:tetratricopeptide (TPR) repeat protein
VKDLLSILFVALGFTTPATAVSFQDDVAALVQDLGDQDPAQARAAWDALARGGDGVFDACWTGFREASRIERVARGKLLAAQAPAGRVADVLSLLDDPAPSVRLELFQVCMRGDLGGAVLDQRVAALENIARNDNEPGIREVALRALGSLDVRAACDTLGRLAREMVSGERGEAAKALPETPRAARVVASLVAGGFTGDVTNRTPSDVLSLVLPAHGFHLANAAEGGSTAAQRAPLVLGLRHPDPKVQVATREAFQRMLARLRVLGQIPRALKLLDELESQGFDARITRYHRALLALGSMGDGATAKASARRLRQGNPRHGAASGLELGDARLWLFRAHYLEGWSELTLGDSAASRAAFARALDVIDAQLAQRLDLEEVDSLNRAHMDAEHQAALVRISIIAARLASGDAIDHPELLELARQAHTLTLEAQLHFAKLYGEARSGWDGLFDHELSPYRLIFNAVRRESFGPDQRLQLEESLGRILATVSPAELPGFTVVATGPPHVVDPLEDDRRHGLFQQIRVWRLEGVQRAKDEIVTRIIETVAPFLVSEEDMQMLRRLKQHEGALVAGMRTSVSIVTLRELRLPGSQALWLATNLRTEARSRDSRRVAETYRADLEDEGISSAWYYLGQERLARADLAIGGTYTDEDEPLRAQEVLLRALSRLEDLERRMAETGASATDLAPTHSLMADVLVGLAVNSNVKLGRAEEALVWYERAYALRQDEFMGVLLACYRARMGRTEEARALLARTKPGPGTYYNLACTHALLGDTSEALKFLELDLRESHTSRAARNKQRGWASEDPDLLGLREDPRFQELVRPR